MKKTLTIVVVLLCVALCLSGCYFENITMKDIIESCCGIKIPADAEQIYHFDEDIFLPERQPKLTVYEFKEQPTEWLEENNFLSYDDKTLDENGEYTLVTKNQILFIKYFGFSTIIKSDIPEEFYPTFDHEYLWMMKDLVFFHYFPDSMRLSVYIGGSIPHGDKWKE